MVWTDHLDSEEEAFNEVGKVEDDDSVADEEGLRLSFLTPRVVLPPN